MNLGFNFRRGLATIPDALDQLVARINTVWRKQHKDDGTHGAITGDSLTVTGPAQTGPLRVEGRKNALPALPPNSGRIALDFGEADVAWEGAGQRTNVIHSRLAQPIPTPSLDGDVANLDIRARKVRIYRGGGNVFINDSIGAVTCTPELPSLPAGIFNGQVRVTGNSGAGVSNVHIEAPGNPRAVWVDSSQPVDARVYRFINNSQLFGIAALNDAQTVVQATPLSLNRFGDATIGRFLAVSGGQIVFPPVQNPSADPNTLDDYEEGAWTPQWRFGGASVGMTFSSSGTYVKVGRKITLVGRTTFTNKGSSIGVATLDVVGPSGWSFLDVQGCVSFCAGMAGISAITFIANGALQFVPTLFQPTGSVNISNANFTNTSDLVMFFTGVTTT